MPGAIGTYLFAPMPTHLQVYAAMEPLFWLALLRTNTQTGLLELCIVASILLYIATYSCSLPGEDASSSPILQTTKTPGSWAEAASASPLRSTSHADVLTARARMYAVHDAAVPE